MHRELLLLLVVVVVLAMAAQAAQQHDARRPHEHALEGVWTLSNRRKGVQVAGTVPGGVYTDLRRAGLLPRDLFYRFNDAEYRGVSKEDWTYSRSLQVPAEAKGKKHQVLVLHGVDTVADVYLNGHLVGSTDNMFVRYRFDVKGILKEDGANTLEVSFSSPVRVAAERAAKQAEQYPVPPACVDPAYHGECGVHHLRKMQASFAWDWGPAFPSMGLWKGVSLEAYDGAVLRDVGFSAQLAASGTASRWRVTARVHWETGMSAAPSLAANGSLAVTLTDADGKLVAEEHAPAILSADATGVGHTDVNFLVAADRVQLWWPQGHGEPTLYDLKVKLAVKDEQDHVTVKVGFRTVELVQENVVDNDPSKGLTYYFRVNGKAIFAKGSNWIPAHVLPELGADPDTVRHLLHSAKEANMNMLRVWGGGVYESDLFYQLADELGIMIWQDMMFACAMYPVGEAFLRSVDEEVRQQYRRLNHHASIVVWAANNENEAALRGNWYGTAGDLFERYHKDYVKLYVNTVRAAVRDEGTTTPFAVSSPSNGAESETESYLARNPYSPLYGDDHHYDYVSDAWNPAVFHHTRFGSEYGFMSWPQMSTMREATDVDDDLALGSVFAAWRQHHPNGNQEIIRQIKQHLNLPVGGSGGYNSTQHFERFLYLSQIYQAMATKTETEFLRRSQSLLTDNGEGRTMGALYWQLNDVWQAPSWAGIDFAGRWKMLHHYAVDFLAPTVVSPHVDAAGTLSVDVVSDAASSLGDALQVHTAVHGLDAFGLRGARTDTVSLRGAPSARAWSGPLQDLLKPAGCRDNCVLRFWVTAGNTIVSPENFLFPRSPKDLIMSRAEFTVGDVRGPLPGTRHQRWDFALTLRASAPAAFVWLTTGSSAGADAGAYRGRFSRNGFHVTSAEPVELRFHTDDERVTVDGLARAVVVQALNDRYAASAASDHDDEPTPGGVAVCVQPLIMLVLSLSPMAILV